MGSTNNGEEKPNVFVTFHVQNEKILNMINLFQRELINESSLFIPYMKSVKSMHMTLVLTRIEESNLDRAKKASDNVATQFNNHSFDVILQGIDEFPNQTLFANIRNDSRDVLLKLHGAIKTEFNKEGFPSIGEFSDFHPHVAIVEVLQLCSMHVNNVTDDYDLLYQVQL